MDAHSNRPTPKHIIESARASLDDIAEGRLHDALDVQAEVRRMLADYEAGLATAPSGRASSHRRPIRSAS
jgi:hypothetical protein